MGRKDALKAYNSVNVSSNAAYADQVQLIQMLFDGLIESLTKRLDIFRERVERQKRNNWTCSKNYFGLQMSLDMEKGGELSRFKRTIRIRGEATMHAHTRNDVDAVIEVKSSNEVSGAWTCCKFIKRKI